MDDTPHDAPGPPPEEATERAQRREQILFERERVSARRRAQRVHPTRGGPDPRARPRGEEFEAGWWTVEQPPPPAVPDPAAGAGDPSAAGRGAGPAAVSVAAVSVPAVSVTVPVTVPMTVPADVWRAPEGYLLELDLPGIDPDSVELCAEQGLLTVSARRRAAAPREHVAVLLERPHGTVVRQLAVAGALDVSAARSTYLDGVLCVSVPLASPGAAAPGGPGEAPATTPAGEAGEQAPDGTGAAARIDLDATAERADADTGRR